MEFLNFYLLFSNTLAGPGLHVGIAPFNCSWEMVLILIWPIDVDFDFLEWQFKTNYIHFREASIRTIHVIGQEILWEFVEGIGGNFEAATALKYVTEENFVERYGMTMSGSSQKIKLLIVVIF